MDLAAIPRTLVQRWLTLLLGLILTGFATVAVFTSVPRTYQARSQAIVLLSPTAGSTEYSTSPFIYLPNTLNVLARVVIADPNTARFRAEMAQNNYTAQYEVDVEPQGPVVRFSVEGNDPEIVRQTHAELLRRFEAELQRIQVEERVPPRQMAHARFVGANGDPDPIGGDRFRAAVATLFIGLLLTLLATFLVERAFRTWAQRAADRLLRLQAQAERPPGAGTNAADTTSFGKPSPEVDRAAEPASVGSGRSD
jgi:capsular polysaccharide biosynthesis protein